MVDDNMSRDDAVERIRKVMSEKWVLDLADQFAVACLLEQELKDEFLNGQILDDGDLDDDFLNEDGDDHIDEVDDSSLPPPFMPDSEESGDSEVIKPDKGKSKNDKIRAIKPVLRFKGGS